MPETPNRSWLLYSFLAVFLWGVWGVISTACGQRLAPISIQVISTLGVVPSTLLFLISKNLLKGNNLPLGCLYAIGVGLCGGLGNLAMFMALDRGGGASGVFPLTGMFPLATVLLAVPILKESMNRIQILGIVLSAPALYLFNLGASSWIPDFRSAWIGYALLTLLLWGLAAILQKLATRHISTELSTVCFGLAFIPIALVLAMRNTISWTLSPSTWTLVLSYGALIGIGTLVLFAAYRGGKASVVTALYALYPALTVLLAIPIFHEKMSEIKAYAIALALLAGMALSYEKPAQAAKPT
jgi:uncharacterized membrane protein